MQTDFDNLVETLLTNLTSDIKKIEEARISIHTRKNITPSSRRRIRRWQDNNNQAEDGIIKGGIKKMQRNIKNFGHDTVDAISKTNSVTL